LYYYTTLYSDSGAGALLVGTTNADEGQYIGYIGKASDAMVDLQIISDLHKSEIYALAKELGVPESIISVAPTGDMFDGRVDEEVFGFPYGFVELYRYFLVMNSVEKYQFITAVIESGEKEIFDKLQQNVEKMHKYNMHKYLGCSPSVHLDVLDSRVPRGWKYFNYESVR
jgi:NAD+ synthase (glutamine-hydrolysing)